MRMSMKKTVYKVVPIRFTEAQYKELKKQAYKEGVPIAVIIRNLVESIKWNKRTGQHQT